MWCRNKKGGSDPEEEGVPGDRRRTRDYSNKMPTQTREEVRLPKQAVTVDSTRSGATNAKISAYVQKLNQVRRQNGGGDGVNR